MRSTIDFKDIKFDKFDIGQLSFNIGVLLISSVLPISIIFLLFSLIISISIKKIKFIKDRWNLLLLVSFVLILLSSIRSLVENYFFISLDDKLIIIFNAFKWFFLFISFPAFQLYLKTNSQRYSFIKYFIAGSIPIILSCILQYWFKIYGPFNFFYGLITWYNKPIISSTDGVSGLFSNQNYTGFWLSIVWPFCLTFFIKEKQSKFRKTLYFIFLFFVIYFTIMTTSRSALIGLIIALPIVLGLKMILTLIILVLIMYYLNLYFGLLNLSNIILPDTLKVLLSKIHNGNFGDIASFTRIKIWNNTINFISKKPLLGFGAGLFPLLYLTIDKYNAQHSHNFILQIAFDYGIPTALILLIFTMLLLSRTAIKIFNPKGSYQNLNNLNINKSWFAASLIATTSQISDMTFFDGKISIIIIILIAGLKCIFEDLEFEKKGNDTIQIY